MVHVAGVFPLFPTRSLIPYKFLECLRPGKPAQGRGRPGPWEQGLGALPATPPHHWQLPSNKQQLLVVVSSMRGAFSNQIRGSPLLREGCADPKMPSPAPKSHPAAGIQPAGRTPAPNPHHVPKATGRLPHHSQLQISPTPPAANPRASSWTQRFTESFPKSRSPSEPQPSQRADSKELLASPVLAIHIGSLASGSSPPQNTPWRSGKAHAPPATLPTFSIPWEKEEGNPPGLGRSPAERSPAGEK